MRSDRPIEAPEPYHLTPVRHCAILHEVNQGSLGHFRANHDAEEIVGRGRRERVSELAWCGEGCFDSRRRVNSTVMRWGRG
jgi:hypothetical protein